MSAKKKAKSTSFYSHAMRRIKSLQEQNRQLKDCLRQIISYGPSTENAVPVFDSRGYWTGEEYHEWRCPIPQHCLDRAARALGEK